MQIPFAALTQNDLVLKATPPRTPPHQVQRRSLSIHLPRLRQRALVVAQAPAGFGKTSMLAQWRREHLEQGVAVAWVTAEAADDPLRLAQGIVVAVRAGTARPAFGRVLLGGGVDGLESMTMLLGEIAHSARDIVLIVDEAERLSPASLHALIYVLRNAPANLRCIVGARAGCQLDVDDLVAYGQCAVVGATELRFGIDETMAFLKARLGDRFDADEAARLHAKTEGWPLGLQLASTFLDKALRPPEQLRLEEADLHGPVLSLLLRNLEPRDVELLTCISIADPLHPDLCAALLPGADVPQRLDRLLREAPVFIAGEHSRWFRMHSLAREALQNKLAQRPAEELVALHAKAADWLAATGMPEAAADHALAAGNEPQAYALAEQGLYEASVHRGRLEKVLQWTARLPPAELERRPRLLLAAAWSLSTSERHAEAGPLVEQLLAQPGTTSALRFECALILGSAAGFADDPDRYALLHQPWLEDPPLRQPVHLHMLNNRKAWMAMHTGNPALARRLLQQGPRASGAAIAGWTSDMIIGLSYLWEGQMLLAAQALQPALASAEAELGRRSDVACTLAGALASAMWEQDDQQAASALLADRLDVLERGGLPECSILAFTTAARMATASRAEHRARDVLIALDAAGASRHIPRMRIASTAEQVRMHARRFRPSTCRDLCLRLDALIESASPGRGPLWSLRVDVLRELAHGHAALAAEQWRQAAGFLASACDMAGAAGQQRIAIEALGLHAYALDRLGEQALPRLREALDLAASLGFRRAFADAPLGFADWMAQSGLAPAADAARPAPAAAAPAFSWTASAAQALTSKEREVLELMARNLSNKEIALAMHVGEETVKWHAKNLYVKLDAGSRKQAVARARLLGMLPAAE